MDSELAKMCTTLSGEPIETDASKKEDMHKQAALVQRRRMQQMRRIQMIEAEAAAASNTSEGMFYVSAVLWLIFCYKVANPTS